MRRNGAISEALCIGGHLAELAIELVDRAVEEGADSKRGRHRAHQICCGNWWRIHPRRLPTAACPSSRQCACGEYSTNTARLLYDGRLHSYGLMLNLGDAQRGGNRLWH